MGFYYLHTPYEKKKYNQFNPNRRKITIINVIKNIKIKIAFHHI